MDAKKRLLIIGLALLLTLLPVFPGAVLGEDGDDEEEEPVKETRPVKRSKTKYEI